MTVTKPALITLWLLSGMSLILNRGQQYVLLGWFTLFTITLTKPLVDRRSRPTRGVDRAD